MPWHSVGGWLSQELPKAKKVLPEALGLLRKTFSKGGPAPQPRSVFEVYKGNRVHVELIRRGHRPRRLVG